MNYKNIRKGIFIDRPNRFIANVEIDGKVCVCHVKNTGRCKELLVRGVEVYLEKSENPDRKTQYDLIAVVKNGMLINMDSQAPNIAAHEFLKKYFGRDAKIYPETKFENSRFDFYIEEGSRRIFFEVKGVTLEEGGAVKFPDAPTERGIKHLDELVCAVSRGYEAYVLFVIQMKGVKYFSPNDETHKAFGDALRRAAESGVKILAYDCTVEPKKMEIDSEIEVRL